MKWKKDVKTRELNDPNLEKSQFAKQAQAEAEFNSTSINIKIAESRIGELTNKQTVLMQEIGDLLKEKRVIDAENVILADRAAGKHLTDKYNKMMQEEEERKEVT